MLVIGLTGGIGSGKTVVSTAFARRGVPVIDTDVLARELVRPGQPALAEIVEQFGSAYLDADGALKRSYLREIVLNDNALRKRLEAILHPRIHQEVLTRLAKLEAPYCVVVIPLLVETGIASFAQRILVVDVPKPVQIARVMARDGLDEKQAQRVLAAQASREQRLRVADDVIENSEDLASLDAKVSALHQKYLGLAATHCRHQPGAQQ